MCSAVQNGRGYGVDEPGKADLSIASNAIGQKFKCAVVLLRLGLGSVEGGHLCGLVDLQHTQCLMMWCNVHAVVAQVPCLHAGDAVQRH